MAEDRMTQALRYLAGEFSVSRQEWRNHHKGGDGLLDALVSHGYVQQQGERFGITRAGRERLEDVEVPRGIAS